MDRNIKLAYLISFFRTTWFWQGIWVFYYLRFTNYVGIGLIETVNIIGMTLFEIPTGAIADILGKKKTLLFAFLFSGFCLTGMGLSNSLIALVVSIFFGTIGVTLYSGTMDALIFDSLKQDSQEKKYSKVLANVQTIELLSMMITSVIGGYLYIINPRLPFLLSGGFYLVCFFIGIFLTEPRIDTVKFSVENYLKQTKEGFGKLFGQVNLKPFIWMLLIIGGINVIAEEMLDSVLAFEFGFSEKGLGLFTAITFLASALIVQLIPKFKKWLTIPTLGLIAGISYLLSPLLSVIFGGMFLIIRQMSAIVFQNQASEMINKNIESRYRATTISTFNMMKNLPYAFLAIPMGYFMDFVGAKMFAFILGLILILTSLLNSVKFQKLKVK